MTLPRSDPDSAGHAGPSRSAAVVAGRLALVAIAAAAALAGLVIRSRAGSPPVAPHAQAARYVCPMHPDVTSGSPGDCPICHMALVPRSGEQEAGGDAATSPPDAYTLPPALEVRGHDALSRAKPFALSFEMRAPAVLETPAAGVAALRLDEAAMVQPGEAGLFSPSTGATQGRPFWIPVRVSARPTRRDGSTALVRFDVAPGSAPLPAGQTGMLKLAARQRDGLVVRRAAIVQAPQGPYVLVASDDHRTFTRRPVEVGSTLAGYTTIVSGLREGEYVLAQHVFVLDLEMRTQGRSTP